MLAALALLLAPSQVDKAAFQKLLNANLPASIAPAAVKRKLWPAIKAKYKDAAWRDCESTLGQQGAMIELGLRGGDMDHAGIIAALVWKQGGKVRGQVLQVLEDLSVDPKDGFVDVTEGYLQPNRLVWCGNASAIGNWQLPAALVYTRSGSSWKLATRSVGDQMSGYPGASFVRRGGRADANHILVIMREYPKYLNQPHVGPLLEFKALWRVNGAKVTMSKPYRAVTALAALEDLTGLVKHSKRAAFNARVPAAYRSKLWVLLSHSVHVTCATNLQYDTAADLFTEGDTESIGLHFKRVKGAWRLAKMDPARYVNNHIGECKSRSDLSGATALLRPGACSA